MPANNVQRPRFKATVVVPPATPDGDIGLLHGERAFDIRLCEGGLSCLARLFGHMSGAYTPTQIASRAGVSLRSVSTILQQLSTIGLVYDYGEENRIEFVSRADFVRLFNAFVKAWRFDMFRHPLFSRMNDEHLFLATAAEYFQLIRDAKTHITIALEHSPDHLKELITGYLASERDHFQAIQPALNQAFGGDFSPDALAPLAATESLILKTRELARSNVLAYLACCSFSEARICPTTIGQGWSLPAQGVLNRFLEHAKEDVDSAHGSLFAGALGATYEEVPARVAASVLSSVHEFKHYFDNLNFEILRTYSEPGASLPHIKQPLEDFLIT